jgi:hypothetical protein
MYEHNRGFQSNEGVVATTTNTTSQTYDEKSVISWPSKRKDVESYLLAFKERGHLKTALTQDIRGSESSVMY